MRESFRAAMSAFMDTCESYRLIKVSRFIKLNIKNFVILVKPESFIHHNNLIIIIP